DVLLFRERRDGRDHEEHARGAFGGVLPAMREGGAEVEDVARLEEEVLAVDLEAHAPLEDEVELLTGVREGGARRRAALVDDVEAGLELAVGPATDGALDDERQLGEAELLALVLLRHRVAGALLGGLVLEQRRDRLLQ